MVGSSGVCAAATAMEGTACILGDFWTEGSRQGSQPCNDSTICALVAARAAASPHACALDPLGAAPWNWARLLWETEVVAARVASLRKDVPHGGSCVALGVDEGPAMIVLELAVLAAGLHFLPVDLRHPVSRLAAMCDDALAWLLVAPGIWCEEQAGQDCKLAPLTVASETLLAMDRSEKTAVATTRPRARTPGVRLTSPKPTDLCYVQFTSGSTGRPKGVLCEHRQAVWYARAKAFAEGVGPGSRVLLAAAFTFDPCQGDAFCALAAGAVLCLVPRVRLLQDLAIVARKSLASHICATPALWRLVDVTPKSLPGLCHLSLGGERMPPAVVTSWAPSVCLRNVYGVTEATVYQSAMRMRSDTRPQLAGQPLPGARIAVAPWCDGMKDLLVPGDEGEVYLGGPGLARGYLGLPSLTAERFLDLPGRGRCYRTGDCGRFVSSENGQLLELLGRKDMQVKLNGERIELGEVEHGLLSSPFVAACAVSTWGKEGTLMAYIVPDGEEALDGLATVALNAFCDATLPRIMRPRRFVALTKMPLTPNGKLDRGALPSLPPAVPIRHADQHSTPLTAMEETVAIAWASELGISSGGCSLGPDADFYSLGGGSVQAVRVTRALRSVLHGGGGGERWAEGTSDWRDPAGDASLFLAPERAGDAECHFGLCDGGPFAPCALLDRPTLRAYAAFLESCGVRVAAAHAGSGTQGAADGEGSGVKVPSCDGDPLMLGHATSLARALEAAIRTGREVIALTLLAAGTSANGGLGPRQCGTTPLHWAAARGSASLVRSLVKKGAHLLAPTEAGAVPAHVAAASGNYEALSALLECGTPPRVRDGARQSLLHYAVRSGDVAAVRLAARHGAEVDARDKQFRSPLHWAALGGELTMVSALLELRANPTPARVPAGAHRRATRLKQETPLECALGRHPEKPELHAALRG